MLFRSHRYYIVIAILQTILVATGRPWSVEGLAMRPISVTRSPIRAGCDVLSILIGLGGTASRSSVSVCLGRRRIGTGIFYSSV